MFHNNILEGVRFYESNRFASVTQSTEFSVDL